MTDVIQFPADFRYFLEVLAQAIEARSDETLQAAQPERRERGPKDAPANGSVIQGQSTGDVG